MATITIVIETLKGSNMKYKYDETEDVFKVKKSLPLGMHFPYDFGFIPGTRGEDGDPLDAMTISEFSAFTGCRMNCRLVGALLAEQTGEGKKIRNDRFFFVPVDSIVFNHIRSMQQFGQKHNRQLEDFFINYNKAENRIFKPLRWINDKKSLSLIKRNSE